MDVDKLYTHTHIIAEGIARYISDLSDKSVTILDDYLVSDNCMFYIIYIKIVELCAMGSLSFLSRLAILLKQTKFGVYGTNNGACDNCPLKSCNLVTLNPLTPASRSKLQKLPRIKSKHLLLSGAQQSTPIANS